ncbi:MAG TPA: hypothetical protein VF290_22180 [Pyrinomonadaceae bacterium]
MPLNRQRLAERAFDRRRKRFGEDLCDLLQTGTQGDGFSGDKPDEDELATNVECLYEEISGGAAQVVINNVTVIATHRIEMKTSDEALALTVNDKIRIHARGAKPQLIFEQPVRTRGTFTPLVEFKAILVTDGYRQSAI